IDVRWKDRGSGHVSVELIHWREMIADCSAALETTDTDKAWVYFGGRALAHGALGDWKESANDFKSVTRLKTDNRSIWQAAAPASAEIGDWDGTATAAKQAVRLGQNEEHWQSWYMLGLAQRQREAYKDAVKSYSKAIAAITERGTRGRGI